VSPLWLTENRVYLRVCHFTKCDHQMGSVAAESSSGDRLQSLLGAKLIESIRAIRATVTSSVDDIATIDEAMLALTWCVQERLSPSERAVLLQPASSGQEPLHAVVQGAMQRHRGDAIVQHRALALIAALVEDDDEDNDNLIRRQLVAAPCAIHVDILTALQTHKEHADVQQFGLTALGCLFESASLASPLNTVDVVITAMQEHAAQPAVLLAATWTLLNIYSKSQAETTSLQQKVTQLVQSAHDRHPRDSILRSNATVLLHLLST